jgi:hypothetical protein
MFFLVSGSAASGKTTLVRLLPSQVSDVVCHDADELPAADAHTRWQLLEQWVQQALVAQAHGSDFLLTSQSPLGELLACPSAPQLGGIAACLLDCADHVRIERIRARGIDPGWPPTQHTLNWASWHRMHAYDPQWEPHVITHASPFPQHLGRWHDWTRGDPRWQVVRVDTTDLTIADTVQYVRNWIVATQTRPCVLAPSTNWWATARETGKGGSL